MRRQTPEGEAEMKPDAGPQTAPAILTLQPSLQSAPAPGFTALITHLILRGSLRPGHSQVPKASCPAWVWVPVVKSREI